MVTAVGIVSDILILATALWGQYWRDRAVRLQDAIQFMVEDEIDAEGDDLK